MLNLKTIGDCMMTSLEASKYLKVQEKGLIDHGAKWGLNLWDESADGRGILFYPEEIHRFKLTGLRQRSLITAAELARAVDPSNNL